MASVKVFFKLYETDETDFVEFPPASASSDIKAKFKTAAKIKQNDEKVVLKLYDKSGYLVNFSLLTANTPNDAYTLQYIINEDTKVHQTTQEVLSEINALAEHVMSLKVKASVRILLTLSVQEHYGGYCHCPERRSSRR